MATDPQTVAGAIAPSQKAALVPWIRLILAWFITIAVLPYAYARTLVIGMMTGRPEWPFLGLTAAGMSAGMVLTYGLSPTFAGTRWNRYLGWWIAGPWVAVSGVLIALFNGPLLPLPYVLLLFVPATLWVAWAVWMCYGPLSWATRLGVLALLWGTLGGSLALLKVEGLSGDAKVNFAWRWTETDGARWDDEAKTSTDAADLTPAGDRDYPQFLGPSRLGVLPHVRLARDWNQTPPREVWRKPIGAGWGAFAVVGNYAITQEQRGDDECVVCYRLKDGGQVWVHKDAAHFTGSMGGPGPRATPTISGGRVYTVGATGLLNCLDGATGRAVWSVNILQDNDAENISHGVCGSPLVVDDLVIVSPTGGNGISLAAYHRDTGKRVWQGGKDQASYGSPLLAELAGVRQVLLYTSDGVAAHDPARGEVLWRFHWTNSQRVNCSQPIPNAGEAGQVFVGTSYLKGCAMFRVQRFADGSWTTQKVWEGRRRIQTKFTTAVLHEGFLYGLDEGVLACIDVATGEQRWRGEQYDHGQVLLAGDLLLIQAENGEVALVEPRPDGARELGRIAALKGKTWNNPALAGPFLLVRNGKEAVCYELPLAKDYRSQEGGN